MRNIKELNSINNKEKWVLITGASSGIGYEFSKIFAQNNYNLILVARRVNLLNAIKGELTKSYKIKINLIEKDLFQINSCKEIMNEVKRLNVKVETLINNAGIGNCGLFHEISIEDHRRVIDLNIKALTELSHLVSNEMIKNGGGKILNVVSTGAYQPGPFIAVYYASKSYVLSFTEALRVELKPFNIIVSALCPGNTMTEFHVNAGKGELNNSMSAKKVAVIGYKGIIRGKKIIIPGIKNKIAIGMSIILPRSILGNIVCKIQQKAISFKNKYI
ncbi:MAG: SDR family oxidoreductase [Clostridium sp.]|uniref:SDR family NAD(P)-dependent oxidoreductase n=1 Tax=Clostridium sp. TaxID=1506 RepID=UPI00304D35A6